FALHYTAQFRLGIVQLIMQPAERIFRGAGMIVLDKFVRNAEFNVLLAVIRLEKEAARIPKYPGAQLKHAGKSSRYLFQICADLAGCETRVVQWWWRPEDSPIAVRSADPSARSRAEMRPDLRNISCSKSDSRRAVLRLAIGCG